MKLILVNKLQQADKNDNSQQVCCFFGCVIAAGERIFPIGCCPSIGNPRYRDDAIVLLYADVNKAALSPQALSKGGTLQACRPQHHTYCLNISAILNAGLWYLHNVFLSFVIAFKQRKNILPKEICLLFIGYKNVKCILNKHFLFFLYLSCSKKNETVRKV